MTKLCKDCKWISGDSLCVAPQNFVKQQKLNLVTGGFGKAEYKYLFCDTHRSESWFWAWQIGLCGKSGRWFEPK